MSQDFDVANRDCFDTLRVAADRGGADLVMTSPPYPDARTPEQYGASFDTSDAGYERLGDAVWRALKPGGVCALNIDGPIRVWRPELGESERSLVAFKVAIDWAERVGLRYIERCIYAREGIPGSHGPRWRSGGELVHVFSRPGAQPYFDPKAFTDPSSRPGQWHSSGGARRLGGVTARSGFVERETRQMSTVITCSVGHNKTDSDHPAPFSSRLAEAFILCYSAPGALVCDPFVGSGTVAFTCHRHGRRFLGGDTGIRERDGRPWSDIVSEGLSQQLLFPLDQPDPR